VRPRSHHVAVDRLEELSDVFGIHVGAVLEPIARLHPVDGAVLACDEAVEARGHMNRYAETIGVLHRTPPLSRTSYRLRSLLGLAGLFGTRKTESRASLLRRLPSAPARRAASRAGALRDTAEHHR